MLSAKRKLCFLDKRRRRVIYKTFGKTGKRVSALGMGVSRFLPEQYDSLDGMENCAQLIVKAWEYGINYFDVAPTYCGWKAETILGMALKQIPDTVFTTTKSSSTQDSTADALRRRLESSLQKLGLERITFYNMWGILNYEQYLDVIKPGGPYEGALKAKEEGLIEHIGFSAHCTGEEIVKIVADDLFEGMTIGYNAINFKYREKGLIAASEKGLGIAIMNPLYGGVIPKNPDKFSFIKNEENQTLAQAALLFDASQEAISVVLSGMSTEEELKENTACFEEKYTFPQEKIASIKDRIVKDFDVLCTGCNYCAGCPKNIKINQLMLSYNQLILTNESIFEFRKYMKDVWRYTEDVKFDCIGCGRCEKKCTQHLPIVKRIQKINQFAEDYRRSLVQKLKDIFSIGKNAKLGIYASGPYAKRLIDLYQELIGEIDFHLYFFDSNTEKWGKDSILSGHVVYRPDQILEIGIDKIIIASEAFYQEIYDSLKYLEDFNVEIAKGSIS